MKKFFKVFMKILLVLVLMFACLGGGMELGKRSAIDNDNRQAYNRGYEDAKSLYGSFSSSKGKETSAPTDIKTDPPTAAPKTEDINKQNDKPIKVKAGSKTYTIRQSVKDELDAYEEYWDKYAETIKSAKNSDPIGYLTKYTEMVQKLEEIDQHSSERDDLTKEEDAYYGARLLEIYQKMVQAMMAF